MNAPITSAGRPVGSEPRHLVCEALDRSVQGHACRIGGSADHAAQLCVAVTQLHMGNDQLPIAGTKTSQGATVAGLDLLGRDLVEHRASGIRDVWNLQRDPVPYGPTAFVFDAISYRLAQISAKRVVSAKIDPIEAAERS
jgi:hypothetical protein